MAFPYSSGDVLTAADLNQSSGLVHVKTHTIGSTLSTVTVTDAFSSTFTSYRLFITVGVANSTATLMSMQLGSTTAGYYSAAYLVRWTGATVIYNVNNGSAMDLFSVGDIGSTGVFDITNPYEADQTLIIGQNCYGRVSSAFGGMQTIAGQLNNTTSYTAFTLSSGTGTISGGTIRVYGYNNG